MTVAELIEVLKNLPDQDLKIAESNGMDIEIAFIDEVEPPYYMIY